MIITMVVSGLWHGAAFTFLIWGFIHGVFLAIERISGWVKKLKKIPSGRFLAFLIVSFQVLVAWVFFRAVDLPQSIEVLNKMFASPVDFRFYDKFRDPLFFLALAVVIEIFIFTKNRLPQIKFFIVRNHFDVAAVVIAAVACVFLRGPQAQFIYFQF